LRFVSGEPGAGEKQRELLARLRAVVAAKDAENAALRQELDAERELRRRLELRLAELERRLGMDSADSGTLAIPWNRGLWVPRTCATWADALRDAVGSVMRAVPGGQVLVRAGVR
jgi:hypothetical protein